MAIIWFVKSGEIQEGFPAGSESLHWFVENLGMRRDDRIIGLETRNPKIGEKEDPRRSPLGGFRHAVVAVNDADLAENKNWKPGFYLLEKSATQVIEILEEKLLEALASQAEVSLG